MRLWVQIPAPDTGWTYFTYIAAKIAAKIVSFKRPKTNNTQARKSPFLKQ